jgi:iron-sulfur cluster insertion protein
MDVRPTDSATAAPQTAGSTGGHGVLVTESAARRLAEIIAADGQDGMVLRVAVSGGGCSGFQYGFTLDDTVQDDDVTIERDGVKVVIDSTSIDLLAGAQIDYVEELSGAAFRITNPNAASSCGCGNSFAV